MNFIGTGAMKKSNEIQSELKFCPSMTPQIEPLIYVPACNIPTMVEAKWKWYCTRTFINAVFSLLLCYIPHFSQGSFQFRRAKVSDTPPPQSRYAIYAPGHEIEESFMRQAATLPVSSLFCCLPTQWCPISCSHLPPFTKSQWLWACLLQ